MDGEKGLEENVRKGVVLKVSTRKVDEGTETELVMRYIESEGMIYTGVGAQVDMNPEKAAEGIMVLKKYLVQQERDDLLDPMDRSF